MSSPWQKFEISGAMRESLARRVAEKSDIFSLSSDPLLASLVSCLGLEFELGNSDQDRTSVLLGVDLTREMWETEIITYQGLIGLRAQVPGRVEIKPLHEDFAQILHPLSVVDGRLRQLVIFPQLVAENYARRGIELVIVKDWVMSAFLGGKAKLNYQRTNSYELESNIAVTQIQLLRHRQLAFSGTHDLGDHLLGASTDGLAQYDALLRELSETYQQVFVSANPRALALSYLIAVMLDDLAQPQWYGSALHLHTIHACLAKMRTLNPGGAAAPFLPQSFHRVVAEIRDGNQESLEAILRRFLCDVESDIPAGHSTSA